MRYFETGATRDSEAGKLDYEGFLSPRVLRHYAEYMHTNRLQADGKLRDSDNWQKGIPVPAYMKSLFRHFMELWAIYREEGRIDVPTACAVLFNVMGLIYEATRNPAPAEETDS